MPMYLLLVKLLRLSLNLITIKMDDLYSFINATSVSIEFCNTIILDPLTPKEEKIEFQGYKDKLVSQQKTNVSTIASICE